ncbi:MAG: CvpA family protein [Clostridiales bacterium]|nr:CvpA family protein [Clostridiales bacterium]
MVDLILLAVLLLALLWGWFRGGMRMLAGLGALIIAFQVARYYSALFAAPMVNLLPEPGGQSTLMNLITMFVDADVLATRLVQIVLFIIIFLLTRWLINKLASLMTGLFGGSAVGILNRVLGALLCGTVMAVAIYLIHSEVLAAIAELDLDIALAAQEFIERSHFILPLIYVVPRLLGL